MGLSATQWVTDDEPMRQQMAIALKRVDEQERRAGKRYQPILFVIAVCKADAEKAAKTLTNIFRVRTLLITEDSDESDRKKARELGREQKTANPYKAVVSVLMLREGWDVPEVGVILLLRKFSSRVYGQQVIGRGLRRVRRKGIGDDEPQICAVVDHPKLEHHWLWQIFGSKIRSNVEIDQEFDETEDLPPPPPRQEVDRPEFLIEMPKEIPGLVDDQEFDVGKLEAPAEPLPNWAEVLAAIEYDSTAVEITRVDIDAVIGRELAGAGWTTIHSKPDTPIGVETVVTEVTDELLRDAIKGTVLDYAEDLTVQAGYAAAFKSEVYSALMQHIREKFTGASLGLADRQQLIFAWKMLAQMRAKVAAVPGLIAGIIEHGRNQ
jgi:type III restriction enzyme